MIIHSTNIIRRNLMMLLVFWLMSIQAVWAQSLSKEDIQETCNFKKGTISFTIPHDKIPEGATCTWTVKVKADEKENEKEVTDADGKTVSADGRILTLNLSQETLKIEVSYTDADNTTQTVSLDDVEPKVYGKEYNGENNTKVKFYAEGDFKGKGSKDNPYIISSDLELAKLAHDVTNGKSQTMYSGKYFQLSDNINLNKGIWMPIGTLDDTNAGFFGGTFDGDGKTISNMKIYWTTNGTKEASWGLFSRLKGKDENHYATVTNLIIEKASLETQKDKLPTGTGTVKIGIVASDLVDYAEVSNIIIRNSKITDHEEKYTAYVCRIGGIIGYLNNQNYRIFNLSSDTEINIHKNATLKKPGSVTVAGAIGCATRWGNSKKNIMPTNIYVHGKKMVTNKAGSTGSVVAFYGATYQKTYQTQYSATITTWFYTSEVGTNTYSDGNSKETADFGKDFTDINNNFINTNQLEKKTWTYSSTPSQFSFSSVHLSFNRAETDELTVLTEAGKVSGENYDWYATDEKGEWKKVNTEASNPFILPRQDYDQNVYAIGGGARTNAVLVKAIHVNASLATSGNTYTVTVTNDTEEKYSNETLGLDIKYQWYNGDELLSETSSSYTRPAEATYNDKYSCHVTVKSNDGKTTFLDTWISATTVVYLKPASSITDEVKKEEDKNIKNAEYGYSAEKPMLTWKGAYSKLSKAGSWDENIIVLMGESSASVTNDNATGFNITANNGNSILTKSMWETAKKSSPLFRNATITGTYKGKDYKGSIEIRDLDTGLPLWGDTRFEYITFKNKNTGTLSYKNIFCQYNNLEMGKGIKMEGFKDNAINYGTIDGAVTTPMQIFGGFNNDGRFSPLDTKEKITAFEASMPHGEKGFSITIKSGFYSAICVGGRQTAKTGLNGVMGTPNLPIKCTITMDIDRAWNDQYNENQKLKSDYDAGIILAGNHEGAMYADVDIIIRSGKVARIVNGTLGAQTEFELPYNNQTYKVPCNTYMGRANILLDPASSVYKKSDDSKEVDNARVVVTELYGGSMGRGHTGSVYINNPFYGNSTITINGGTFKVLPDNNTNKNNILCGIFGAGAGGMNGIGYGKDDAKTHTPDESIAYWNETKDVMLYGPYKDAKSNLVSYHCYNAGKYTYTDVNPLKTNTQIIINDGIFGSKDKDGEIDGIYAGGSGYMSPGLWTSSGAIPSKTGGNVYGSEGETAAVSLTINGGTFYCKNGIFAGGRGTYWYYSNNPYGAKEGKGQASDYTALGQTYGNVALNIYGGTFHCPIFGGGYGVADARLYNKTDSISTLSDMARIYGKSNVTIYGGTFYQNIYGGGDMAVVENEGNDATNVIIGDKANILGSVFAGGKGRKRRLTIPAATTPVSTDGFTKNPKEVGKVIGDTNVTFTGSSQQAPSIYGDIYGGGNYAQVDGSTNVNIIAANFAGQVFGGGMGNIKDESGNELTDKDQFTSADVSQNTNVTLAQDMGGQEEGDDGKPKDSFSINVIWDKIWDAKKNDFIIWNPKETEDKNNRKYFYGTTLEDDPDAKAHFLNPHNIYGGGNLACNVNRIATVEVLKGMTPFDLLNTEEWKESYNDNNFPHFSVFGGGYGEHTTVAFTSVTVNVEGDYSAYDAEVDDDDDTEQMARPHNRRNASKTTIPVFDNSKGIPNFTILGVLGGGYAGTVTRSTMVTVDGNTFLHRVYGGGFGDPYKNKDNTTGQIGDINYEGSRTEVYIKGGNIYGDVFGGGAGVAPKTATGIHFTNVARVIGNTKVEISDKAKIYGKVYGGGDMANVGPENYTPYYSNKPQSSSNLDKDTGDININEESSYIAENYRTLVNIIGGDIFGSVFGGGKGLRRDAAEHYDQIGRINGNTIVHVANTAATSINSVALDYYGNTVPYVWYNIYGGCAYGTVAGNTLVHIEGGMLGRDVFGGGYGDIEISEENQDTQEVLGEKDTKNEATYANILGNTKVQMDGGTWIWNQNTDINGNITTWLAAQGNGKKICSTITEFREITEDILKAETKDQLTNAQAKAAIESILNDEDSQQFFSFTSEKLLSGCFKKNNNIYGGGNRACFVGTYTDSDATTAKDGTGEAIVIINHSPLNDITDKNGEPLSMFDFTTLPGLCWYLSAKNPSDPQFSVFGAGYGANTKVAKATVYAQPGSHIDDDGIIEVDGAKYRYLSQKEDFKTYTDFEKSLYEEFKKVSKEEKKKYYGSVDGGNNDGTDSDPATFRRYRISRLAWTLGLPGFSFQTIHGGGFSGYVTGDSYVETDCQLFCENIYGAGLGAVPFGEYTTGEGYDFGKVGGNSKIFIKSGFVGQNVYGGGAGVESVKNMDGEYIDFPDMANVQKTEVHVYGRKLHLKKTDIEIDRTLVIGSVYGGGDVANVGNKNSQNYDTSNKDDASLRTTLVNIRGAGIYSQVFAGGKGRLATQCGDITHLGAIYGNTSLLIDRPVITYPYRTEAGVPENPSSDKNMAHPADNINATMLPLLMEKIYGGCQNGTVYGNTFVTLYDGKIGHGIYGGGLGSCDTLSVDNEEKVVITSADVKGNTNVYIKGGQAMLTSYWLADTRSWEPAFIDEKTGITYSPQYNHQALKFKINHNIYAGGNIACVVGKDAHLTMEKGLLHDDTQVVYGVKVKFFDTMVWKEIYNKVGSPHFCVFGGGYGEHTIIKGNTHVNIAMTGRGSKIDPSIDLKKGEEYKHFWSGYSVMDFVGGGYSGKVEGETYVTGDGGAFCRRLFGGGFYNSVKATHVDIYAMDCRDIFGGGMMGDVEKSTTVNIGTQNPSAASSESTFSNKDIFIHGNVYGGNDVSGYVNVVQKNGNFTDNKGEGTHINIYGGKIDGDVYGAGNGDYLYALDRKGNTQITVNENYPLNLNDPNSETTPLVFTVPMRENMPSHKAASDAAKMVNINSWRPMTNKVNINIMGNSNEDYVLIKGDVYGGGNSATVLKAQKADAQASAQASSQSGSQTVAQTIETVGSVAIKIGSNVNIRSVFMGCNGDALFTASEDNNFMNKFQKLNGDYYDTSKELDFADSIDWENDPSNKGISTLYLPTENAQRPLVYPHLLDLYFQPVEMNIQGTLKWAENLTNCTIGSFYCGGNRGNMNIYPNEKGKVVDYSFPEGLTITSKIVGGCNNANYDYKGEVTHEGGYLLGTAHSEEPFIKLTIKNKFEPAVVEDAYQGGCVYGGCYKTGTVRGDVTIDLRSDMLAGKDQAKLEKSNEYLATNPEYSSLNIYGAGYGMESYVYGNTRIVMGDSISCKEPAMDKGKFSASGVSANFIYGGGQQGNVIGLTDVDILNGHVFRSVTGGSYSGYVYGSTQVKVGYPTYYQVNPLKNGKYILERTDQKNLDLKNNDGTTETPTIKQEIYLLAGELISQGVYDDIVAIDNGTQTKITENNKGKYFTPVAAKEPTVGWKNVHINIDEAIYGGGYSLAQGTSVLANNTTVLKLTDEFNVDKAFANSAEHEEELKSLPGGTTAGFGGNTLILVGDSKTNEHITISKQDMKEIDLPDGTDLYGYYYKHYDDLSKEDYTYRFIYEPVTYFKDKEKPEGLEGCKDNVFYEYDSEGGIFGDGHLSYAQGFRSADITGYGFAGHTIDNPKIINTLQRMDLLRLEDNCFSLLGARDYTVNEINKTPYSIARVGEIKMVAGDGIELNGDNLQVRDTETKKYGSHARNFMGLVNNIHYVGAVKSSVSFSDTWYGQEGNISKDNKSYQEVKQAYIDNYNTGKQEYITQFQARNNGTAKNMIGIASGYALKIQNAQEVTDSTTKKMKEKIYYGPIYGVIEINLVYARKNEGGGYVYADNIHERPNNGKKDFLETTGNFVFPLNESSDRYIVDDCSPIGFNAMEGKDPDTTADIHYWYVTGLDYYYNAHITGYTYKEPIPFYNDNSDGLTALAGLKAGQMVTIKSWKMRSGHLNDYSCDLEKNASNKYTLYVGASDEHRYNPSKGFAAKLPMSGTTAEGTYDDKNYIRRELQTGNAKIAFMLADSIDNTQDNYYTEHLSKKCQATLVLEADALNDKNEVRKDDKGNPIKYTYTIYLTIEYVQGPTFTGHITIDNCALPGEMIRLKKDQVKISADQAFAPNGYFWHIGKLKRDKDGKLEKGDMQFDEETSWLLKTNSSENTYKQGDKIDDSRKDLFAGSVYDKTRDYLDIPAYYFMNGYGVQLGVTMNGFDNVVFPVNMAAGDTLTVHNYHQMDPHKTGVNLHLPEAIQRAKNEAYFAEPRIYINDASDLKAFINFVDTTKTQGNAQFILQSDLTVPDGYDGSKAIFKDILHGNGHVIKGLGKDQSLFSENQGKIYNLGLTTGSIAAKGNTKGTSSTGEYHCCFEYAPASSPDTPIVYGWDGKKTEKSYTHDDFKYGKVAYDLNGYYLIAKQDNSTDAKKAALKYVYDYYANGDYQYAHRTDEITGNNTGITYLRKGQDSDLPNYGQTETRHDKTHKVDEARAIYTEATAEKPATFTGTYRPLLNENDMNDFLFWGQSLQSTPEDYPAKIASQQKKYMINRVYRTDGYYGNTTADKFYYNAYNQDGRNMGTYVHRPTTTAINFAASDDNATSFYDFIIKDGVTRNLLVYTEDNKENNATDAYDIVSKALSYDENTAESLIKGHHIVKSGEAYATQKLHLVERTPDGKNSEGDACVNNDFCVPIPFSVTNHAWYVRKPLYYAENTTGAWEGICLPFTVQKAEASINGEITHFYGTEELHHEYWLRGLTEVKATNTVNAANATNATEKSAIFQRPGAAEGDGLFHVANAEPQVYEFHNTFFVDTYKAWSYNEEKNSYYNEPHTYSGYLPLTAGIPYVVRFPGKRYYEFDLSSKFYNSLLNKKAEAQTVTFHAYGEASDLASRKAIVIPVTGNMGTENINGFSHRGTFAAQQVDNGTLGMNDNGTAFVATSGTVMPFRTYMAPASQQARVRSTDETKVIRISETTGIDRIEPEANGNDEDTPAGEYLLIRPIGAHRVSIESTYATQLKVFSTTGQLHRILDVQPGTATYSGFPDGIYIFGKSKIMVK